MNRCVITSRTIPPLEFEKKKKKNAPPPFEQLQVELHQDHVSAGQKNLSKMGLLEIPPPLYLQYWKGTSHPLR